MGYSIEKVDFKAEEHDAAKAADQIYEMVSVALKDGLTASDIAVIAGVIQPSTKLWGFLAGSTREEFAARLIAIGVMLARDNFFNKESIP